MYIITERKDAEAPSNNDPLAQAMHKHTGSYDLRDSLAGRVIVASSRNIHALRRMQALNNTKRMLD